MSALAILGCFSACTSVLGINEPVEPDNNECRTFVCKDDVCKYQYSDFGIPCGGTNICSEFGECKTGTLQPCNQGLDCASGQCLDSLCRLNTEHRCMNDEECGVDICTDNICKHTDGSSCDQASECASGRCLNTCLGSDGSSCTDGTKCASGGCDPLTFTCKTSVGRTCQMDKECASGVCVQSLCSGQSCSGLTTGCGPKNESCCMSTEVTGGTYNRAHNTPSIPKDATISTFHLDRFEVTVGRFRKFVDAYPESKPKDGVGQHAQITGSAWNPEWDQYLPATRDALIASLKQCSQTNGEMPQPSWSDTVGMNENLPINCVSWYLAFAFCAWDGGRLPTEAEWGYAAIRDVQVSLFPSIYPWGNLPPDISYLTYNCSSIFIGSTIYKFSGGSNWFIAWLASVASCKEFYRDINNWLVCIFSNWVFMLGWIGVWYISRNPS